MSPASHRKVILSAAQLAPAPEGKSATLDKALTAIAEAARAGSHLIAFPEVFLTGYPFWTLHIDPQSARKFKAGFLAEAATLDGPEMAALEAAARQHRIHIVMGLTERQGGTAYNTQAFFGPEGRLGHRRKVMPTHHERMVWGMGDGRDFPLYETAIGRLGGLICFEHTNALYRYALQGRGEEIHVAMWPGGIQGIEGNIDRAVRHYAFEGQCFVVNVTAINTPEMIAALGGGGSTDLLAPGGGLSGVIDCRGNWVVQADPNREEVVHGEVDFAQIDALKMVMDSAGHYARPDIIRCVIDQRPQSAVTFEDL
ncbi:MAG: hypothetical protein RI979_53 [Pseudomonadota bacterium]|jgi:nitrilase